MMASDLIVHIRCHITIIRPIELPKRMLKSLIYFLTFITAVLSWKFINHHHHHHHHHHHSRVSVRKHPWQMTKSQASDLGYSKYLNKEKPIFVAGGRNGVGYHVIRELSSRGTPVHTLVNRMESMSLVANLPGVTVKFGDAMNPEDVQNCMEGCVAAVAALTGSTSPGVTGDRVEYVGNSNVIEQAGILGVERIILVTSLGCGPTKEALSPSLYGDLRDVLMAKDKAERDLKLYTNLDWTIIRPGGLKNDEAPTGEAILTEDFKATGFVRRADVAHLILKILGSKFGVHKELSAVDPTLSKVSGGDEPYKYVPYEIY